MVYKLSYIGSSTWIKGWKLGSTLLFGITADITSIIIIVFIKLMFMCFRISDSI